MATTEISVHIDAPLAETYRQWSRFEQFPRFMEGVREVRRTQDDGLLWRVQSGGRLWERNMQIFEQEADQRVAWRSMDGRRQATVASFAGDAGGTTLTLDLSIETEAAHFPDPLRRRFEGDLRRFKALVEREVRHVR